MGSAIGGVAATESRTKEVDLRPAGVGYDITAPCVFLRAFDLNVGRVFQPRIKQLVTSSSETSPRAVGPARAVSCFFPKPELSKLMDRLVRLWSEKMGERGPTWNSTDGRRQGLRALTRSSSEPRVTTSRIRPVRKRSARQSLPRGFQVVLTACSLQRGSPTWMGLHEGNNRA